MKWDFSNVQELWAFAHKTNLYSKLIVQLKKDFELANVSLKLREDVNPEELETLLHEKIYFLLLEKFQEYLNLLYVVDVPERELEQLEPADAVVVSRQVAFLVMKRELKKVWFREKYV